MGIAGTYLDLPNKEYEEALTVVNHNLRKLGQDVQSGVLTLKHGKKEEMSPNNK
ncbi:MAG: hypothetical protein QW514_09390 [Thermoprotei archaeon]